MNPKKVNVMGVWSMFVIHDESVSEKEAKYLDKDIAIFLSNN